MKNKKIISYLILALIIIEIVMSLYLIYSDFNDPGFCSADSCGSVQDSEYGNLFGLKLSYFALICFSALLIVYIKSPKKIFLTATTIGTLFALYFISIQIFVLGQICRDCMIIDGTMIGIFILGFFKK